MMFYDGDYRIRKINAAEDFGADGGVYESDDPVVTTQDSPFYRALESAVKRRHPEAIVTPIIEAWSQESPPDFPNYEAGSWGPEAADQLLARDGRKWRRI